MFGGSGAGGTGTTTALPEAELTALIEQASRYFDQLCGVPPEYFEAADTTASNKTFYGDGTNYLHVGPYVAGSLNTTLTYPDGYTALTFTERDEYLIVNSSGVLPPFARFTNAQWPGWYQGVPITISAKWGYEETPADVVMAVIELVINLERETDPASLKLKDLEGQPLREKAPPRTLEVARRYRMKGVAFV